MKKDASRFSPKGVLFHRTFFTAPISQSDLQCFSHEDGCFTAGNEFEKQPARLRVHDAR